MYENIKPLEKTDPLVALLFMDVANKIYHRFNIKAVIETNDDVILVPYMNNIRRNDLCWCKSGLKYKKCHGKE